MTQPQPREPVVVEPVVNREKLRELLALETEYPTLDFKSVCDLGEKREQVELAKDIGAMSLRGGFLVIGADGQGKPTGKLTVEQAKLFDEARLRPKLLKWLPDTLEIYSQAHDVDGNQIVLVHIAPNPAGCAFFRTDGQYDQPGKAPKIVFREGEVFFRDGTQSVRLNHQGLEQVIRQRVERERDRWEAERAETYRRLADELRAGAAGQHVAQGPAVEFNLALEPDVLVEAAIELVRANDDIPLRRLLSRAVPDLRALFKSGDEESTSGLLDRLTCLAAAFLELRRGEWFEQVIDTLVSVYGVGFENEASMVNTPPRHSAVLWLAIIERVLALGALAVRRSDWPAVRDLVARRHPEPAPPALRSWPALQRIEGGAEFLSCEVVDVGLAELELPRSLVVHGWKVCLVKPLHASEVVERQRERHRELIAPFGSMSASSWSTSRLVAYRAPSTRPSTCDRPASYPTRYGSVGVRVPFLLSGIPRQKSSSPRAHIRDSTAAPRMMCATSSRPLRSSNFMPSSRLNTSRPRSCASCSTRRVPRAFA
ncbi:ATP-binding protein [Amycolatopsis thermoflava]|uniref:ATP-binding protein n=1 Tax=Amycolatopsis thermoflava TaxID=84480 RepID=UPI003824DC0F